MWNMSNTLKSLWDDISLNGRSMAKRCAKISNRNSRVKNISLNVNCDRIKSKDPMKYGGIRICIDTCCHWILLGMSLHEWCLMRNANTTKPVYTSRLRCSDSSISAKKDLCGLRSIAFPKSTIFSWFNLFDIIPGLIRIIWLRQMGYLRRIRIHNFQFIVSSFSQLIDLHIAYCNSQQKNNQN